MLLGCDISKHQGSGAVKKVLAMGLGIQFIICKATEGVGYQDKYFGANARDTIGSGKLLGAYHYARPDLENKPYDEAFSFVQAVKPYIGKCLFALDWEGESLKYNSDWALQWCKHVENMTGVKPVIYVSESQINNMRAFAGQDYGLWVAKWSNKEPKADLWNFWTLWQYTNNPIDMDRFNGNADQFMKYCEVSTVENEEDGHFCGCTCGNCCCRKE